MAIDRNDRNTLPDREAAGRRVGLNDPPTCLRSKCGGDIAGRDPEISVNPRDKIGSRAGRSAPP